MDMPASQQFDPRTWLAQLRAGVDYPAVVATVAEDARWSGHYLFMVVISAGIAVLGLLLSSPAVVIGAMLVSPLMGPILGLGVGVALFDQAAIRRALVALGLGIAVAVGFTALVVAVSPLQTVTAEIAARTRPNLFDLLVALLSGLAGTYALIRGRQGAIVGVAIAVAVMPPLATVGFGLATANWAVMGGAAFLFFTNLMAIALAAAAMARLYGIGASLSPRQSVVQAAISIVMLAALAVPLGLALRQIAWESLAQRRVREELARAFPRPARLADVEIRLEGQPAEVGALVFTSRPEAGAQARLTRQLSEALGRPVRLTLEQVRVGSDGQASTEALAAARNAERLRHDQQLAGALALAAGVPAETVLMDRQARIARVRAAVLPGATLASYRALEARVAAEAPDWQVELIPPPLPPGRIAVAAGDDGLDLPTLIWAAQRLRLGVVLTGSGGADVAALLASAGVGAQATPPPARRPPPLSAAWTAPAVPSVGNLQSAPERIG